MVTVVTKNSDTLHPFKIEPTKLSNAVCAYFFTYKSEKREHTPLQTENLYLWAPEKI